MVSQGNTIIEELDYKNAYRPQHMLLISDRKQFENDNPRKLFLYDNY